MEIITYIINHCTSLIESGGFVVGFFLVFIECFIPALPLSVFVALNVGAFGFFVGILISWMATCLGSYCCYIVFLYIENKLTEKFLNKKMIIKIRKSIDKFSKIKFTELVLLLTLPFTPSSLINALAGLTRMSKKKFIASILIGKLFSIVFWGYIGKSIIESLTDISSIIYIIVTLIIAYIISKIISRKINIE